MLKNGFVTAFALAALVGAAACNQNEEAPAFEETPAAETAAPAPELAPAPEAAPLDGDTVIVVEDSLEAAPAGY